MSAPATASGNAPGFARMALVLGLLCCVGPFAIDMFLPALPTIAADLAVTPAATQATLSAYFLSFGLAQIVYGPMADATGRKPALLLGLVLFLIGSVGCVLAPSLSWLVAARFVQGLGGASLMVVPRAVIRDLYTGTAATRLMALVMLVISVSPMLAPLVGSGLIAVWDWRAVFVALMLAALAALALTLFGLPETLRSEDRVPAQAGRMLSEAGVLLRDPGFMGLTFVGAFGMGAFFVYLAAAPFVLTGHYGLSPTGFSLAFAINAIGFFAASQLAAPLGERLGALRLVNIGLVGNAATLVALAALMLAGVDSLVVLVGLMMTGSAFMGVVIPTVMVLALEAHGERAGMASSLGGTLQMVTGTALMAVAGAQIGTSPVAMSLVIALCGLIALGLGLWVGRRPLVPVPAE